MRSFEQEIEEQLKLYKTQLENELQHLYSLMKELDVHSEERLNTILEFAELFLKLKNEGVVKKISNNNE